MDGDKVKCGCNGEVAVEEYSNAVDVLTFTATCEECGLRTDAYYTEADALAAFQTATRADVVALLRQILTELRRGSTHVPMYLIEQRLQQEDSDAE